MEHVIVRRCMGGRRCSAETRLWAAFRGSAGSDGVQALSLPVAAESARRVASAASVAGWSDGADAARPYLGFG